ncbi:MAG: FtsX-like permease family protein [Candidatus Thorarchaeota archaeon]
MSRARRDRGQGNRLYALSYALGSMRAYPFRALSLAITLSLGVSLVGSVLIWADTGVQVSVNTYFDENAFQMLIQTSPHATDALIQAEQFARQSPFVEQTYLVNSTVGLVYGTELPDDIEYGIDSYVYSNGLKDCQVIFVDDRFLNLTARDFTVEGRFSLQPGEVLVSTQFVNYVHEVFGTILTLNSTVDIELLMRSPTAQTAPIGELGRQSLRSLRIVGIYEVEGYGSLIEQAFPSMLRSNYDYVHYDTPVLGIRDSVMVLSDSVDLSTISDNPFFTPQVFVRALSTGLVEAGPDRIADNLLTLKSRMEEQFGVTVLGAEQVRYLQGIVDTYINTMSLISLNLPLFILALFLSVFAADTFMAARKTEVSALRSKGASSTQIYGIFISETIVMAAVSIVLGILLSILFAALIPSTVAFLKFDWNTYQFYLENTVLKPQSVFLSVLICIVPPLLFILNAARHATRTEIGSMLVETAEPVSEEREAHRFTLGISIVLLIMVVVSALFFPPHPVLVSLELGLGTASWFFLAYNGSRVSRVGFARLTSKLSFILGEKNLIAAGNLKMRKGRIVPLMVVLALTLSSTVAFSVQAHSFQTDLEKEVRYAIGSDLRVSTTGRPFEFANTIEAYPGVDEAMPILQTWGAVGQTRITIEALDPLMYLKIAHFDPTSFNGEEPKTILRELASVENGILLSQYHASRWNKTVGDTINIEVGGRLAPVTVSFKIVGIVYTAPGFGYASTEDIPQSALGAAFGFQARYTGFGIANVDYVSKQTGITTARLFLADLVCITDQDLLIRALSDLPGVSATTPERFDLARHSFGTALFLSTIEGLFSIGFAMSLLLSIFSLTLFLGSIVRERRRDYAILRAVGSSRRQLIRTVLSEFTGVVLASLALSLILGTIFGYTMSIVVFSMSPFSRLTPPVISVPVGFLTVVVILEMIAMIGGSYLPAKEAAKTNPAIVLRNL